MPKIYKWRRSGRKYKTSFKKYRKGGKRRLNRARWNTIERVKSAGIPLTIIVPSSGKFNVFNGNMSDENYWPLKVYRDTLGATYDQMRSVGVRLDLWLAGANAFSKIDFQIPTAYDADNQGRMAKDESHTSKRNDALVKAIHETESIP